MRTSIISIGKSKGVRIPKVLLDETGIVEDVEIRVMSGTLRISPVTPSTVKTGDTALLSERVLSRDWLRPEEDKAWAAL